MTVQHSSDPVEMIYDYMAYELSLEEFSRVDQLRQAICARFPEASGEDIALALVSIRPLWEGLREDNGLPAAE